jgi:hypothetical protein
VICDPGVFDTFLAIAIDNPEKRAANRKVWVALAAFNDMLRAPLANPDDASKRLAKSLKVEDAACYDCAWLSLTALSTVTCNLWL